MSHSYIVYNKITGKAVIELFNEASLRHINTAKYAYVTALVWLQQLNREIKGKHLENKH